jgi:Fe-S-cluster containining protein
VIPDCLRCGACCTNPEENRREGFRDWVEVDRRDVLLRRRAAARLVVYNQDGQPHLRLDGDRCAALRGRLGVQVSCSIYEIRPRPCRRVEPGSERCRQYRRERQLE